MNNNLPIRALRPVQDIVSIKGIRPAQDIVSIKGIRPAQDIESIKGIRPAQDAKLNGVIDWIVDIFGGAIGEVAQGLAQLIFKVSGYIVKAFPQPLRFIFENIGWIILGLLILIVFGFLNKIGII
jgi:hypothetical protein